MILCSKVREAYEVGFRGMKRDKPTAMEQLLGGTGRAQAPKGIVKLQYNIIFRRIYRPPIPPRWPLLAQDKWCACVLSTRWGSTSELVIDNFNVLVQVVSLGIFWLSAVVPSGL